MFLIVGILFAFASLSLTNQGQSAAGGCQKFVPIVNEEECRDGVLRLEYPPVLSPNSEKNSKPSKRFQICKDDEGIGKNANDNAFNCTNDGTNRQIYFHGTSPGGNAKEAFKNAMKDGAYLADYLGIWMFAIDFELRQNCQSIVQSGSCELTCENNTFLLVTKIVPTTTMSPEELALFSKCNCSWEPFEKAILKINNGEDADPTIDFAGRVGYIENSTEKEFEKFVKKFLRDYENAIGEIPQSVHGWMEANNDWIHELPYNEFRYVPLTTYIDDDGAFKNVTGETPMMFAVFRCPFVGAFAIAPIKYDEKLAGKLELSNIQHNWTNDFDYLFDCKHNSLIFNWDQAKFSVQEKDDGVDAKEFDLDVGIIFKKDKTNRISLTPARIEANKYMFGFSRPLRNQELNQTANNYKLVVKYGVFFLPPDEAYQMKSHYLVTVASRSLDFDVLTDRLPANFPRTMEYWKDRDVIFYISQENIDCPEFNVTFPRINAFARVDTNIRDFPFMFKRIDVYNSRNGYSETMHLSRISDYELYKQRKN